MEKINKILAGFLLFIVTITSIITIGIYAAQKAITKDFISSVLDDTDTSELLIRYSDKNTKESFITIHDYIYKSLNVLGIDERIIDNSIINEYIESLSDAILTDVLYNYLNNEKTVIQSDLKEMEQISKLLTKTQKEKLEITINDINTKIINYMDEVFEENRELQSIKNINNFNIKPLIILIIVLVIISIILINKKIKALKNIINIGIGLVLVMLLFNLVYKYIIANIILKMEKYGNSFQIFFNQFIETIGIIWKNMVIILVISFAIYLLLRYISKQNVKKEK